MSSGVSLTSWEEDASSALVGHPSNDGVNKNTLWSRCFIISMFFCTPSFPIGFGKTESYPFLAFSDMNCHLEDTGIGVF